MRTLRRATGRRKSTSAANLLQPQRPQEASTVRHKTSMLPICWALLGQRLTPRCLTGRHKSTSVANLLEPWCPQVVPTERRKPSMPPICWSLSGLLLSLRLATVKQKSLKAADLLRSRWSSVPSLMVRRKSRRAAKLSVGAEAFCFFYGYGASDVRSRMGRQSHCAWSGRPSDKMPHRRAVLYAGRWRGTKIHFLKGTPPCYSSKTVSTPPVLLHHLLLSCRPTRHYFKYASLRDLRLESSPSSTLVRSRDFLCSSTRRKVSWSLALEP